MNSNTRFKIAAELANSPGDPAAAATLGALFGGTGAGIYSGAHHGLGAGLQTGLRTAGEGIGGGLAGGLAGAGLGAGAGKLLQLIARRHVDPNLIPALAMLGGGLGASAGGLAGSAHGAYRSMQNRNLESKKEKRKKEARIEYRSYPMTKSTMVADQFMKHAIIRHENGQYTLYSHQGKTLGKHPSKAKAIAQEQAIKAHGG